MQITARAEPRYYIELTKADAELIDGILGRQAKKNPSMYSALELTQSWLQYLGIRENYREVCEAAGYDVSTSKMVNATHVQLEKILSALSKPGLMDAEMAMRVRSMVSLMNQVMLTACAQFRQHEVSMVSVDLMETL